MAKLVDAALVPSTSVSATWILRALLKRHEHASLELGGPPAAQLIRGLDSLAAGDAQLHVCQTIAHVAIPARNAEQLARFLRRCAGGDHKFVRAWSVDALHRLSEQHVKYRSEARAALRVALDDPAASVRARARHIAAECGR